MKWSAALRKGNTEEGHAEEEHAEEGHAEEGRTEEDHAEDAHAKVGCPKERVDMLQKLADTRKDWVIPTNALVEIRPAPKKFCPNI